MNVLNNNNINKYARKHKSIYEATQFCDKIKDLKCIYALFLSFDDYFHWFTNNALCDTFGEVFVLKCSMLKNKNLQIDSN